jgi:streptogramin lyase
LSVPPETLTTGYTSLTDLRFDVTSGKLWVDNAHNPAVLYGYNLALSSSSTPASNVTITGSSPTNTSSAFSFAFDPSGKLWVADSGNNRLLGYNVLSGMPSPFTTIAVPFPYNVISDSAGDLYVASNHNVVRLNAPPTAINSTLSTLSQPYAMLLDGFGNLYVGDFATGNLYRYNAPINDGATPAITDTDAHTTLALDGPSYMALDNSGNLYVSDCSGSVKVFATASFSSSSGPAYTLPLPAGATCSEGLAIL